MTNLIQTCFESWKCEIGFVFKAFSQFLLLKGQPNFLNFLFDDNVT